MPGPLNPTPNRDLARSHGSARTVAESNAQIEKKRQASANTLHFAASIFASSFHKRLSAGIFCIESPMREWVGRDLARCHTPDGCLEKLLRDTGRGYNKPLTEIVDTLQSVSFTHRVGFSHDAALPDLDMQDECVLSQKLFEFGVRLIGSYLTSLLLLSDSLPMYFGRLLHPDGDTRVEALARLHRLWTLLQEYEQNAADPDVGGFLRSMLWPSMPWVREVLLELDESMWHRVPERLTATLRQFAQGWGNTNISEDIFQVLRGKATRGDSAGKMSRQSCWEHAWNSNLLAEYGRPPLPVTATHRSVPGPKRPWDESYFEARASDITLDSAVFGSLTDPHWKSPAPESMIYGALTTIAMERHGSERDFLRRRWHNSLCVPNSLVYSVASKQCFVVAEVFNHGVLVLKASARKRGQRFIVRLGNELGQQCWEVLDIQTLNGWKAVGVLARPPAWTRRHWPEVLGSKTAVGLCLQASGTPMSLEDFAASRCFAGMTMPELAALAVHKKIVNPPKTEVPLLTALMKAYTTKTADEIKEMIHNRGRSPSSGPKGVMISMDDFDLVSDLVDEQERQEFRDCLAKDLQTRAKVAPGRKPATESISAAPRGSGAASSSSVAGAAAPPGAATAIVLRRVPVQLGAEPSEVQYLRPRVEGCTLTVDRTRFMRWVGYYPRTDPPRSRSKVWTMAGWSEHKSLLYAVAWLWQCHREAGGDPCPWDLEEFDHLVR